MKNVADFLAVKTGDAMKMQETKRPCSPGLEFLMKNGTPKSFLPDGEPCFLEPHEARIQVIDYAGSEDCIIPSVGSNAWFEDNLSHCLPRCSDLDSIVVLLHCQKFPIACTVPFMLNGSAGVNEFSARYAELPHSNIAKETVNEIFCGSNNCDALCSAVDSFYNDRYRDYKELVDMGVSRELSRGVLPTSQHTEFFTRLSLFHFIQFIQIYDGSDDALLAPIVDQMKIIFQLGFPKLYRLFSNGVLTQDEKQLEQFVTPTASMKRGVTCRGNSEKMEMLIGKEQFVANEDCTRLDGDKCWVKVINYSGTERTPYEAVGMSFGVDKSTESQETVESLLELLVTLGHCSPFELTTMLFESQVPFFVFRHLIRHRSMGIHKWHFMNDVYMPMARAEKNKMLAGGAQEKLKEYTEKAYKESLMKAASLNEQMYDDEMAYLLSPASRYVSFNGRIDIHNLVHILNLRTNPAAQYETRMFAYTMQKILQQWVPAIYNAFIDNKRLDPLSGEAKAA
jgi:flavin-dependent thymidylate synthase